MRDAGHTGDDPTGNPEREAVDRLVLPTLRDRAYRGVWFLFAAMLVYAVTSALAFQPDTQWRLAVNTFRLAAMGLCLAGLRGPGSPAMTAAFTAGAIGANLLAGSLLAIERNDPQPMILALTAVACASSVLMPWGAIGQALLSLSAASTLAFVSWRIHAATGSVPAFEASITLANILLITPAIAHYFERSRETLRRRLDAARTADLELAELRRELEARVAGRTAELQAAIHELEIANRELERFSYAVSHDLRSPLRTISGFSQVILDEAGNNLDESSRRNLDRIRAATARMDKLIDDMLRLARVSRSNLRYDDVDVASMARQIVAEIEAENPEREVVVRIDPIPRVRADPALLHIALDNLLRNAWRFTPVGRRAHVRVSGENAGPNVVLRVHDDGIGFDPRFRSKLFQPFERIHDQPGIDGTGIGLATVARIAWRHGGDVDADGKPDGGATFSLVLPREAVDAGRVPARSRLGPGNR